MYGPSNKMTRLLNKIERRLGTKPLNLPEEYGKEVWAREVIAEDSLVTFSRYFPNRLVLHVGQELKKKRNNNDGYYIIDDHIMDGIEILGVQDIDWKVFSQDSVAQQLAGGYGLYSALPTDYNVDDALMIQARADMTSIFNNPIICDYQPPNMVRITGTYKQDVTNGLRGFPVTLMIKHADNLMTIPPTQMETFEALCQADVAGFLYENLKYFEFDNPHINVDLKLSELQDKASKRDEVIETLKEGYISFANKNQPAVIVV